MLSHAGAKGPAVDACDDDDEAGAASGLVKRPTAPQVLRLLLVDACATDDSGRIVLPIPSTVTVAELVVKAQACVGGLRTSSASHPAPQLRPDEQAAAAARRRTPASRPGAAESG